MAKPKFKLDNNPFENVENTSLSLEKVTQEIAVKQGLPVEQISLDDLEDNPFQTKAFVSAVSKAILKESLDEDGYNGYLVVRPHPEKPGKYQIGPGGHSRREIARELEWETLPCIVKNLTDRQMADGVYRENEGRQNLSIIELGRYFLMYRDQFDLTQEELTQYVHQTRDYIKDCESAAQFPDDIREMILTIHKESEGTRTGIRAAKYLNRLSNLPDAVLLRMPLISGFLSGEESTETIRIQVERLLSPQNKAETPQEEEEAESPVKAKKAPLARLNVFQTLEKQCLRLEKYKDEPYTDEERELGKRILVQLQTIPGLFD